MSSDNTSNNKENTNPMTKEDAARIQAAKVRVTRINNDNPSNPNPLSRHSCEAADNIPRPNQCPLHEVAKKSDTGETAAGSFAARAQSAADKNEKDTKPAAADPAGGGTSPSSGDRQEAALV
ncbi:hypothetical protein PG985_002996 [Apiospora marii]|uniref:uncharacterized protein n=1 Tax=Apiospora marii TaxID=335849 RepID=UPI00312D7A4A